MTTQPPVRRPATPLARYGARGERASRAATLPPGSYTTSRDTTFQSLTGYIFSMPEADGYVRNVAAGASDLDLGEAMRAALDHSRFIPPDGTRQAFYNPETVESVFYMRLDQLAKAFGYGSRRQLLKGLKYCTVTARLGEIQFEPTRHTKSVEWEDLRMSPIVVQDDVDTLALGAAVRLSMNTCSG